ncbi:MAG TPA: hypothetical protein VFV17_08080 [Usitatibacteraceae bacterium]|nr:hypothetical protein [Usitatibacteraceae bacterium]
MLLSLKKINFHFGAAINAAESPVKATVLLPFLSTEEGRKLFLAKGVMAPRRTRKLKHWRAFQAENSGNTAPIGGVCHSWLVYR